MTKKSNVYTRTGDLGTTALVGGTRVRKNDGRVKAYGDVDELNSFIALLLSSRDIDRENHDFLQWLQHRLFDLGAYLATDSQGEMTESPAFGQETISRVEHEIDRLDAELPPLTVFILPGGSRNAALANVCRTVCRRAERQIVELSENIWIDPNVIRFINRLSDYFFVLGRAFNAAAGTEETAWKQEKK